MARHSENKDIQVLKYNRKIPTSEKLLYCIAVGQLIIIAILLLK